MNIFNSDSLRITAKKEDVLKTLKANRERHATIVVEARDGYLKKAQKVLEEKLSDLRKGKISSLIFQLAVPVDHTKVYDTAIQMLELHTGESIEMDGRQVQSLIQDEWDWTNHFVASNSGYSATARSTYGST